MKSEIKANSVQWTRRFAICLFLNGLTPALAGAGTYLSNSNNNDLPCMASARTEIIYLASLAVILRATLMQRNC